MVYMGVIQVDTFTGNFHDFVELAMVLLAMEIFIFVFSI